ncbi:cold-shock protein [Pleomorphovibrio marinus]|uniref:cold-shock protein n=1 Tax=Pleomorphovibrio marinus TaxID=2164132 RepID=UPI000E0C0658|nr:cold shock domain-containing protein [Pleomorphovibrio marinus]
MAKSRVTFNKKEKEKKRLRKKKEKEEKKEARKASSSKGAGMEDMIAYVDADGNISDTPPDPDNYEEIEADDIEISVSKNMASDDEPSERTGKVSFFNSSKGYGFIEDEQTKDRIFVHATGLVDEIEENDRVTFETERTPKGLSAIEVKRIDK